MKIAQRHRNTVNYIKRTRYQLGMTQTQFAELVGVSTSTIKQWERGRNLPSPANFTKIENAVKRRSFKLAESLKTAILTDRGIDMMNTMNPEDVGPASINMII